MKSKHIERWRSERLTWSKILNFTQKLHGIVRVVESGGQMSNTRSRVLIGEWREGFQIFDSVFDNDFNCGPLTSSGNGINKSIVHNSSFGSCIDSASLWGCNVRLSIWVCDNYFNKNFDSPPLPIIVELNFFIFFIFF